VAWGLFALGGGPAYERLAVLPPANLMNDPEQEYFVQGVHTALISELQRAGVVVIARQSMLQYENTQKPIRDIAAELGVDALIEPSVFRAADTVEIEARLVDGMTEQYVGDPMVRRGEFRNVVTLYRELTGAIAAEIQASLTPQAEAFLASARPVDPQVQDAYLKGQFHWQRLTETDLDQAFEYFQQALSLDSTYAPAQAGIALVWWMRGATAQANAAAQRALALDSTLAEVQHAVGMIRTYLEWDWVGGEAAFRKAIEINPNYADARAFYWGLLGIMGRGEEAQAQIERALALDPFNALFRGMHGVGLLHEGRYAEAIEELEAAERMGHPLPLLSLTSVYHLTGNYDEALVQLRMWYPGDQELDEALDRGYAEGGYRTALLRYAETLAARPDAAQEYSLDLAFIYAWAGDKERTLEWLELAYQARNGSLPASLSRTQRDFELVHDDPRYHDLRRRMGLPEQ
jgi:adenylate cyclase